MDGKTAVVMAAATVLMMAGIVPAYANHGIGSGSWTDGTVTYHCMGTLDDLTTTSNVDPCRDMAEAASVWNGVNSSFELRGAQGNGESTYGTLDLASHVRGQNASTVSASGGFVMTYADISFNTDHTWAGRVSGDWWEIWLCYDFISVAAHGSGHTVRLEHDSDSALMRGSHDCGEVYRTPSDHDKASAEVKYP